MVTQPTPRRNTVAGPLARDRSWEAYPRGMTRRAWLHAYIDEAGQRSSSQRSSSHFVMSAVVLPEDRHPDASSLLGRLRSDLGRRPDDVLHWRNLKTHSNKLHVVKSLAQQEWATISTVVVCKRHILHGPSLDDDQAYLYTFRLVLERLSWLAASQGRQLRYTLAHVVRFKIEKLRAYETVLRALPTGQCQVKWSVLDPKGGQLEQPKRIEYLQLADTAASATFAAFEPDSFGNTETRYLQELADRLYRRTPGALTSYGLKIHPWTDSTRAAYPWVAAL